MNVSPVAPRHAERNLFALATSKSPRIVLTIFCDMAVLQKDQHYTRNMFSSQFWASIANVGSDEKHGF
jgi:hypothetical protein